MKKTYLSITVCVSVLLTSFSSHSALVSRLNGNAVYDTDLNITLLANAQLAGSNSFGVSGIVGLGAGNWNTATSWIDAMNADGGTGYLGFNDWRLPSTRVNLTGNCGNSNGTPVTGWTGYCTNSEMGHLFYNELEGAAQSPIGSVSNPVPLSYFQNLEGRNYWATSTATAPNTDPAWVFSFNNGHQSAATKNQNFFLWAVRDGDVATVPVPAAAWLFGSGLISLIVVAKRKKT